MQSRAAVVVGWMCLLLSVPAAVYLTLFHGKATAAAVVATCFGLVVWSRPDLSLVLLLGLVPVTAVLDPAGTATAALVAGGVAILLLRILLRGLRLRCDLLALALVVLLALAAAASHLLPPLPTIAEGDGAGCAALVMGLALVAVSAMAPADPRRIAQVVALSGAAVAGHLLVQGEQATDRLIGLGLNPNYLGAMLALPLVATAGLARLQRSWLWLLPALVLATAITETRSRGAFLMVAAGVTCVLLAGRPLRRKVLIAAAAFAAALLLPGTLDAVGDMLTGNRQSAELSANNDVRGRAAWVAARMALDHPLRGIGYGAFPDFARMSPELGIYINTHNDYLRLAAESGVSALVLFAALLWLALARRHSPEQAVLQSMGVAAAVGLLFANALASLLVSVPFWVLLGCLLAQSRRRQPAVAPPSRPLTARKT
ncbi:O-antigen ligase family protein [Streptomyces sp. SCSIO 30461]|uniref:O-antigen ligase family protein n=1 Tax=Streptomyces sp. SCSIO 30461 TaxID=3118085 RepID=UPI0030D4D1E9